MANRGDSERLNKLNAKYSAIVSLVSGASAGALTTTLCSPLDVAKTRMQVQGALGMSKYRGGTVSILKLIFQEEGLRGFFRGLGPSLITVPLFWGVYWSAYDYFKVLSASSFHNYSTIIQHLFSAIAAGSLGDIISNPFWVVRTRIQTQALHCKNISSSGIRSTFNMFKSIYKEEGVSAFFKGLSASLLGLSHVAIQFPLYEYLKSQARMYRQGDESMLDLIIASSTSKLVASFISYPHEVLRARLQDNRHKSKNIFSLMRGIVKNEGFSSLWSGFQLTIVRVVPASVTTFVCYEYMSRYMHDKIKEF